MSASPSVARLLLFSATALIPLFLVVGLAVVDVARVVDGSMRGTLNPGDLLVIVRSGEAAPLAPGAGRLLLTRGAVVVLRSPLQQGKLLVKRIVGVGGDRIRIDNGVVLINDQPYADPVTAIPSKRSWPDPATSATHVVTVPAGQYFVLSDNRVTTLDSRVFGSVGEDSIVGVVLTSFASGTRKNDRALGRAAARGA